MSEVELVQLGRVALEVARTSSDTEESALPLPSSIATTLMVSTTPLNQACLLRSAGFLANHYRPQYTSRTEVVQSELR